MQNTTKFWKVLESAVPALTPGLGAWESFYASDSGSVLLCFSSLSLSETLTFFFQPAAKLPALVRAEPITTTPTAVASSGMPAPDRSDSIWTWCPRLPSPELRPEREAVTGDGKSEGKAIMIWLVA